MQQIGKLNFFKYADLSRIVKNSRLQANIYDEKGDIQHVDKYKKLN